MKMTSRDKELLFLAMSLGIVAASWFGGARLIREKTEEMKTRQAEYQAEYDDRLKVLEKKDEYIRDTENYNNAYTLMMSQFPGGIAQDQQILFVTKLEEEFHTQVTSVSYTDEAAVYQFQSIDSESGASFVLSESIVQIPVQLEYSEWKRFIDFVFTYPDKNTMPQISAQFDAASGKVNANITLNQFAVSGEGRAFEQEGVTTVPIGTQNIFTSGTPLTYGGSRAEQIEAIKNDFDCYLMLYPTASDVKAKVIAGNNDAEKVVSEKNEEEKLVVKAEENGDGTSSITYTLGDNRPHALNGLDGETLDFYVLSTPRRGGTDLSSVRVEVDNQTSKTLRIAVTGDDSTRPRFVLEQQSGSVELLK